MATEIGKGVISIEPEVDGFGDKVAQEIKRELSGKGTEAGEQVGEEIGDGVEQATKGRFEGIGQGLKNALTKGLGVLATIKVGQFVGDAIHEASRLEQAIGGTAAVFQEAAGRIDEWAKKSVDAVGLSEASYRELAAQIGGQLKSLGFTLDETAEKTNELIVIGADLAATFGGTTADAVNALGAALRGEFNPLERYGVALRMSAIDAKAMEMGLASTKAEIDNNARAQATLALIMEQTRDVQGQFAREADTAAGAQQRAAAAAENARAKFGEQLLPVFMRVQQVIGFVATAFAALPGPVQTAVVAFAALGSVAVTLSSSIKKLGLSFSGMSPWLLGIGAALTAASALWGVFANRQDEVAEKGRDLAEAMREAARGLDAVALAAADADEAAAQFGDTMDDVVRQKISEAVTGSQDLQEAMNTFGLSLDDVAEGVRGNVSPALQEAIDIWRELGDEFEQGAGIPGQRPFQEWEDAAKRLGMSRSDLREFVADAKQVNDFLNEQQGVARKSTEELVRLAGTGDVLAAQALKARGQLDLLSGAMRENAEAAIKKAADEERAAQATEKIAEAAQRTVTDIDAMVARAREMRLDAVITPHERAVRDLADAFDDAARGADAMGDAVKRIIDPALDAQAAYDDYLEAIAAVNEALKDNGQTLDETTEKGRANREALREIASAGIEAAIAAQRNGASQQEAAAAIAATRDVLIEQAMRFGLTRAEAEAYASQLGLTPERIATAVELAQLEQRKGELEDWLKRLGDVDKEVETEIKALLDRGALSAAEKALAQVSAEREVELVAQAVSDQAGRVLDQTARKRIAEILADPKTRDAEGNLNQTARKRIAEVLAQALYGTAEGNLNNTARQRIANIVAQASTASAEAALNNVARDRQAVIIARVRATGQTVIGAGEAVARAAGGPVRKGRPYLVGEEGPEWFVPKADGVILPHGTPPDRAAAGGDGMAALFERPIVIHNVMELDGKVVHQSIRRIEMELAA